MSCEQRDFSDIKLIASPKIVHGHEKSVGSNARLAQSVERKALNLVVVGSSPTVGDFVVVG